MMFDFSDEERLVLLNSSLKKLQEEVTTLRIRLEGGIFNSTELADDIFRRFKQSGWESAIKEPTECSKRLEQCKKLLSRCHGYLRPNEDSLAYVIALMWHECHIKQYEVKMSYINEIVHRIETFGNGEENLERRKYNFLTTLEEQSTKLHDEHGIDFPHY